MLQKDPYLQNHQSALAELTDVSPGIQHIKSSFQVQSDSSLIIILSQPKAIKQLLFQIPVTYPKKQFQMR